MPISGAIRHESVSVAGTAVGLTVTPADGVRPMAAMISVETAAIRFCVDGTTATASVGHMAEHGDVIVLVDPAEVAQFSAISKDGGTATLKVTQGTEYIA